MRLPGITLAANTGIFEFVNAAKNEIGDIAQAAREGRPEVAKAALDRLAELVEDARRSRWANPS